MGNSWHVWQTRVRIGDTPVGKGVFALKAFRREKIIGVIQGIPTNDPEYGSSYCMDLGDNRSLEPIPPFRYLNHSCDPNTALVSLEYKSKVIVNQLLLEATRDIRPGEQLTIDYGWAADAAIPCRCGAANCRGWIVDERELGLMNGPAINEALRD